MLNLRDKFSSVVRESKEGYAVLIVGVLFAVGMVVVSTQIARQTVSYQRTVGNSLEENISENFADNMANRVLSRLMKFGSGYYELGKEIDFSVDGNAKRESLGFEPSSFGDGNNDIVMKYDFIGASIVPVPSAYSFSGNNAGNNFSSLKTTNTDLKKGVVNQDILAEYGFYDENRNKVCDNGFNYGKGDGDYNIFKRMNNNLEEYQSSFLPNYRCGQVFLTEMRFEDPNRVGEQWVVTNNKGKQPANYYYTVPALGTGDAGTECSAHEVEFGDTWSGGGEYIDPLDHPCNWNVMEKGETVKFGLSGYSMDEVIDKTGGNVGGGVESLALTGTNLEDDIIQALEPSYYEGVGENDVMVLRVRLRCVDGSSDCHPGERYEFFDREFLNEFDTGRHAECVDETGAMICSHSYTDLASHNLSNPEFDFTPLVFGYGLADGDRFLPMRGDYNLESSFRRRYESYIAFGLPYFNSGILSLSRNAQFDSVSVNKLRGDYLISTFMKTKSVRNTQINSGLNSTDYAFSYDNQNKISNVLINNLEFPYQEQGFRFDYESDYFHLYLLNTEGQDDDLKNPEFVLSALDDFIEVINRQTFNNNSNTGKTYSRLEYQIVSDKVIGLDQGYLVYDFGFGKKINKNKYNVSGVADTGFVNVSN